MAVFKNLFSSTSRLPKAVKDGGNYFFPLMSQSIDWTQYQNLKDFIQIPELNAIISGIARAFSNAQISIVSKTTGKEVNNMESLVRLLRNPNWFQGQKEFLMQTKLFHEIYGNEFLYFLAPVGRPNSAKALYSISPNLVDIKCKTNVPYFNFDQVPDELKYIAEWDNKKIELERDNILHLNNANIDFSKVGQDSKYLYGVSKMQAVQPNIQNLRASYEARNVLIENRGALGILSNGGTDAMGATLPMNPEEKEKLQNEFKKYGVTRKQWQVIITNLNLKWQQMTIDADKLKLFEENKADAAAICDVYGYPFELLGNEKGVTFENKKTAEKGLYQNTIIPAMAEWVGALNRKFDAKTWEIIATYDHLPIFQEDLRNRGAALMATVNALSKALADGAITIEQYKDELKTFEI